MRRPDRNAVLGDGPVREAATHEELVESGGRYAELFELEAGAYR